jgi:DNA-directed RNA polymerase specialized sigma24 family protein
MMERENERENNTFQQLLKKHGGYALEKKMSKLPSYQAFYKRWPRDGMMYKESLDELLPTPDNQPTLEETMVMKQTTEAYLSQLTPRQQTIVQEKGKGYRPREIAKQFNEPTSGKVRWHLFAAKRKLIEFLDEL